VVGLTFYPGTDTVWGSVEERDALGDDLVPDYFTAFKPGAFLRLAVRLHRPERGSAAQR
jgi:glucose/arabinose dehydrogenase